jgi:hypothetical protein
MNVNGQVVNVFPASVPPDRLQHLLTEYRRQLRHPQPNDPPRWYAAALVSAIEGHLRAQGAAR